MAKHINEVVAYLDQEGLIKHVWGQRPYDGDATRLAEELNTGQLKGKVFIQEEKRGDEKGKAFSLKGRGACTHCEDFLSIYPEFNPNTEE